MAPNTILLLAWVAATTAWLLAMTRWKKRILEKLPAGSVAWYWLRLFDVEESERNRERFLVGTSATGIALFSALALLVVLASP